MRPGPWGTGFSAGVSYVVDTKVVQRLSDLNFLSGVEKRVGKLLSLSQGALDDLERADIAEEVGDGLVGIPAVERCGLDCLVVCLVACNGRGRKIRICGPRGVYDERGGFSVPFGRPFSFAAGGDMVTTSGL